jgi:hypothetical protein
MIWQTKDTVSHGQEGVYTATCELFSVGVRWSLYKDGKLVRKGITRLVATTLDRMLKLGQKDVENALRE